MERKNSFVIVGAFVLIFLVAIVFSFLWIEKHAQDAEFKYYRINTKDSASGLSEKTVVKFNGLTVGEITKLFINEDNLEEVSILIKVKAETPIKTDTKAIIESQGITGLSYVQLVGGSTTAKELATSEDDYGVIESAPSILSRVDKSVTAILDRTENTLSQIGKIANDKNLENIEQILENLSNITTSFADTMSFINTKVSKVDAILDSGLDIESSVNQTVSSINEIVKSLNEKIKEGGFDINQALDKNLSPIQNAVNELAILLRQFRQNLEDLNDSPSDIFFKSNEVNSGPGE